MHSSILRNTTQYYSICHNHKQHQYYNSHPNVCSHDTVSKVQPDNTIGILKGCPWESNPTSHSSRRAAWVPLSAVQHCASSCSNSEAKYAWMPTPWRRRVVSRGGLECLRPWARRFRVTFTPPWLVRCSDNGIIARKIAGVEEERADSMGSGPLEVVTV